MPVGTASNIDAGPGQLFVAPQATTAPTDATTSLITAFKPVGYTEDGSDFSTETQSEDLFVAEELLPVSTTETSQTTTIGFSMAEVTAKNFMLALNQGVVGTVTAPVTLTAPNAGVPVMLVHQTPAGARWVFRKAYSTGAVQISSKKGTKRLIQVQFKILVPDTGAPVEIWPAASGKI
jgi:hypothetical protein